jgi:hypothetical protein
MRKDPETYSVYKKRGWIEEKMRDELVFVIPVIHIVELALKSTSTRIEERVPDFTWGAGWILGKVAEHLELAVKHYEDAECLAAKDAKSLDEEN